MANQPPFQEKPFVSREQELLQLSNDLSWILKNKKPHMAFVHGDFGVGKTTLIETFIETVKDQYKNILVAQGRCSYEDQDNGRVPFIQMLNELLRQQTEKLKIKKALIWLKTVAPVWADFITFGLAGPIMTTIDASISLLKDASHQPEFTENQIFMQFTNAIGELAEDQAVVLFIDDLHWADESSLKLSFHLMNNLVDKAVMLICTYRTYDIQHSSHAILFNSIHANLRYKSLAFDDIELVRGIHVTSYALKRYGKGVIPSTTLTSIQEISDGLAIFVVELFNLWEQKRILQLVEQTGENDLVWQLAPNVPLEIPKGIKELLKERVSLLDVQLKNIVTGASVEGEDFSAQTISKLFAIDQVILFDDLDILVHKFNLIKEQGEKEISSVIFDFYRFAHQFIREYIYNEMPKGKRREMHQRWGECLRDICQDPRPFAGQIAHHFEKTEKPEQAVEYMLMAARYEAVRYSWAESQNWCRQGLSILESLNGDRANLKIIFLEQLARSFDSAGNYKDATVALSDAIKIAEEINLEPQELLDLYVSMSDIFEQMEDFENELLIIEKGKKLIKSHKIPLCETRVDFGISEGLLKVRQGKIDSAIKIFNKNIEDAKKIKQDNSGKKLLAGAWNCLGVAYSVKGDYKNSVRLYQLAVDLIESTGDITLYAYYMINMIEDSYWITDNSDELQSSISKARKLAYQAGDVDSQAYLLFVDGSILLRVKNFVLAKTSLMKAIELWDRLGLDKINSQAYSALALVYLGQGDMDRALANARKGVELASYDTAKGYGLDTLGVVEFARDDISNSISHLKEAISLLKNNGSLHYAAVAQRHYAEVLFKIGNKDGAIKVLDKVLKTVHGLGIEREERMARELKDKILI